MSYTSHGDLFGGIGVDKIMTKESQLRSRSQQRNAPSITHNYSEFNHKPQSHKGDYVRLARNCLDHFDSIFLQDGPTGTYCEGKIKHLDNPFIDNSQKQTVVDMKGELPLAFYLGASTSYFVDVMVLNDIIEQAAGLQGGNNDHGGNYRVDH